MFEIKGKVAIVTGGAAGIGLEAAKHILREGARGLTIADIDPKSGKIALDKLKAEFGKDRVIFVKTDVSKVESFEDAFKRTLETFHNVDILFNNAGIFDDMDYARMINVNLTGVTHGILLGMEEYIAKYRTGSVGVIISNASILVMKHFQIAPIYAATKSGIAALTMGFGNKAHFERTGIKIVAVAPGFTDTSHSDDVNKARNEYFIDLIDKEMLKCKLQTGKKSTELAPEESIEKREEKVAGRRKGTATGKSATKNTKGIITGGSASATRSRATNADYVARSIIKIIREKPSGTIWISEDQQEVVEYVHPYENLTK